MSEKKGMVILRIFAPRTIPTARSKAFILIAVSEVTNSGKEVTIAKNIVPIKVVPQPVRSAKLLVTCANFMAVKIIIMAAIKNLILVWSKE